MSWFAEIEFGRRDLFGGAVFVIIISLALITFGYWLGWRNCLAWVEVQ